MFSAQSASDALERLRIRYIRVIAFIGLFGTALGMFFQALQDMQQLEGVNLSIFVGSLLFIGLCITALVLVNAGYTRLAFILMSLGLVITAAGVSGPALPLVAVLALILSAVVGSTLTYVTVNILILLIGVHDIYQIAQSEGLPLDSLFAQIMISPRLFTVFISLIVLALVSLTVRYFVLSAERTADNARRSAELLRTTAEVGRVTAGLLNVTELLARASELIRDGFAYYHVQVFLIPEGSSTEAILRASTGEIGQQLLTENYKLEINTHTVVGRTLLTGEPILTRDTDPETYARHALLANTRSELAIPILDANRIVGALDVHSLRREAFSPNDMQALQIMANQLGTAIRNARLFEAQNRSLQENKRLFVESEARLREMQRLNQQLTKRTWTDYLEERRRLTGVTLEQNLLLPESQWTDSMIEATQRRQPLARRDANRQVITVPIVLRGEVLGAIEVEPDEPLREGDTVEMLKAVAERLATSLENTRLLEETQAENAQKQRINEIAEKFQSITTVDELLRVTVTELRQSLGAERGSIRLGTIAFETKGASL
ncbi:MAG: GAF domain-containing protein [Chloroflexi bacterium]|nr:GAF domain-containing protein [Chloroflexota bacterium]